MTTWHFHAYELNLTAIAHKLQTVINAFRISSQLTTTPWNIYCRRNTWRMWEMLIRLPFKLLRRIFEPTTDKITERWRQIYNEKPHNLKSSDIIMVIQIKENQTREEWWEWDVLTKFWLKSLYGRDHSEDLDVDGRNKDQWRRRWWTLVFVKDLKSYYQVFSDEYFQRISLCIIYMNSDGKM